MSDRKILAINPDMFNVSNNKSNNTRKRRESASSNKIKVRSTRVPKQRETMKKKSILKMIREQQSARYNNQTGIDSYKTTPPSNETNSEFNNANQFFANLEKKTQATSAPLNHTFKRHHTTNVSTMKPSPVYSEISSQIQPEPSHSHVHINASAPKYGCLKNGVLPTYRSMLNQTRKSPNPDMTHIQTEPIIQADSYTNIGQDTETRTMQQSIHVNDKLKQHSEMKQMSEKIKGLQQAAGKRRKRKKTVRRTYKVGRSTVAPKISVLVSNKTLRNNITSRAQVLNQVSIIDIKKYLIKHGLIRVGSTTPNDVLRKMYESAVMVCGEIQNHNQDTLLYNFMNNKSD